MKTLPTTRWWIKSDGADVTTGLMESSRQEWYGDVDLGDGELQKQYEAYMGRLKLVDGICREIHQDRHQRLQTCSDLRVILAQLKEDREFIDKGSITLNHVIVHSNFHFF